MTAQIRTLTNFTVPARTFRLPQRDHRVKGVPPVHLRVVPPCPRTQRTQKTQRPRAGRISCAAKLMLAQKRVNGSGRPKPMSVLGQKQTFAVQNGMSALPPKADTWRWKWNVR